MLALPEQPPSRAWPQHPSWEAHHHAQRGSARAAAAHAGGGAAVFGRATLPRRGPALTSAHWLGPDVPEQTKRRCGHQAGVGGQQTGKGSRRKTRTQSFRASHHRHHYHPSLRHHHLSFRLLLWPPDKSLFLFSFDPSPSHTCLFRGVRLETPWGQGLAFSHLPEQLLAAIFH